MSTKWPEHPFLNPNIIPTDLGMTDKIIVDPCTSSRDKV